MAGGRGELVESFGPLGIEQFFACETFATIGDVIPWRWCATLCLLKGGHGSLLGRCRGRCRRCVRVVLLQSKITRAGLDISVLWMLKNADAVHQSKTFRRRFCFEEEDGDEK